MTKISAVLLVGKEYDQVLYERCLKSLSWVDEIVEVKTANMSGSFSEWRNEGARRAKSDWLLYVDIDEEITNELREEIQKKVLSKEFSGYAIPRINILLGKRLVLGGWYPDYVLRLIKKSDLKAWEGDLHEQPVLTGKVSHIVSPMVHISHRSISEMIGKTNKWSEIEAKLLFNSGHPPMNILRFFSAGVREFWRRGIVLRGIFEGRVGIIEVLYQTFSRWVTYTKLWELQIKAQQ